MRPKTNFLFLTAILFAFSARGAEVWVAPPTDDLASLSEEFDNPSTLTNWKAFSKVEGWPDRIEKLDINQSNPGHLFLVPRSAAWWMGYHGVFLFKEVRGDFLVMTRAQATGKHGALPRQPWTISGLMARKPGDLGLPREKRPENWSICLPGVQSGIGAMGATRDSRWRTTLNAE